MRPARLVLVALLAAALAGCLASGGPSPDAAGADGAGSGSPAASGGNATGPSDDGSSDGSSDGGAAPGDGNATSWWNQTRTGTFAGAHAVFGILGTSEDFEVPDAALELRLTIHAPDAELSGSINPPCDSGVGSDCPDTSYETAGGVFTYQAEDPEPGTWTVTFFRGDSGAGVQDYVLDIGRHIDAS